MLNIVSYSHDSTRTRPNCRGCGTHIKDEQVVLVIKLGTDMPFDKRRLYLHVACTRDALQGASDTIESQFDALRAEMIASGSVLV